MIKVNLAELINLDVLQTMFESINKVIGLPISVMDTDENVLASAGGQDICTKFHRIHPETTKRCRTSDQCIKMHIGYDDFITYKCLNHMWDAAVPIIIEKEHIATLFIGPFFYDEEVLDIDLYKRQAEKFGFDENEYLDALNRVPRFPREKMKAVLEYYRGFVINLVESSVSKLMYINVNSKLNRLFNSMQEQIILLDHSGIFLEWNRPVSEEWCLFPEEIIGNYYYDVLPYEQCSILEKAIRNLENDDAIQTAVFPYNTNNKQIWFSAQMTKVSHIISGKTDCYMISLTDITEKKRIEEEVFFLNFYDRLTGVYNRSFYEKEMKQLDCESNLPISIILGDVNGLKVVNDAFGHNTGDELLCKAASAIKKTCRDVDLVARWGGDEFVMLLPKTNSEEAERIIKRIKEAYSNESVNSISVSISFGWETKTSDEEDIMKVLKKAEDYMYKHKLVENKSLRGNIIDTIINTLHEKNSREEQHSKRVSTLCQKIGIAMGLSEIEIHKLKVIGLLHDIGKIAIGEGILNKPGKLTDMELNEIKRHPDIGYRILSSSQDMLDLAECVLAHHERWDGKGYPKGLSGNDIPKLSRIVTVADSYDAMTSERPYRGAMDDEEAYREIRKNAGTQFDPEIAYLFIENVLGDHL